MLSTHTKNTQGDTITIIRYCRWVKRTLKRLFRYTIVGSATFLLDLFLLFVFIDVLQYNYIFSAGVAFLIAVSINYVVSRNYVFSGTLRETKTGYFYFVLIVLAGLLTVLGGMYILVTVLNFNYLISRLCIALTTGIWNYLMNLFVNFKVAGQHID